MAEEGTTAQVHPQKLTAAFMEAAQASGAKLLRGSVQGITVNKDSNSVTGDHTTTFPVPPEHPSSLPHSAVFMVVDLRLASKCFRLAHTDP